MAFMPPLPAAGAPVPAAATVLGVPPAGAFTTGMVFMGTDDAVPATGETVVAGGGVLVSGPVGAFVALEPATLTALPVPA